MASLLVSPVFTPVDSAGKPYPGASLYIYQEGTSTLVPIYADADQSAYRTNPMVADSAGQFDTAFLDSLAGYNFRYVLKNAAGVTIWIKDGIPASGVNAEQLATTLWPRTADEIAAGVTPSNYGIPSHDSSGVFSVERYGFLKSNSTIDQSASIQAAYNVAVQAGGGIIDIPESDFRASVTVYHPGIVFRGKGGISSATVWRNVDATAPVTFNNSSRGIVGSGLERIKLQNQNPTYTTTDGLVISSEATGLNQMDYLGFRDVYIVGFRNNIAITGRCIWGNWSEVRSESALNDGLSLTGSDNFSQNKFYLCRFGNAARHGFYANLTFAGLTATSNSFDTCTFEQNEQNGIRITGTYGLSGWTFSNCYFEENAGAVSASSTSPRKAHFHLDCVYAFGLRFEGSVFYGNTAPDVDHDYCIYVDTSTTVNVTGEVENCRFTDTVVADVYWPKNVYLGMNQYAASPTYTATNGSVSLSDQQNLATFTPGVSFGGGTTGITYSSQVGRYQLIGRTAVVTAYVALSAKGSSTGSALLTGLPITAANVSNLLCTASVAATGFAGSLQLPIMARVVPNSTTVALYKLSAGTLTALTDADFGSSTAISITLSYFI